MLQALSTPILFTRILIPYLMLVTGLSISEAGLVLTIASAMAAILNAAVGMALDRVEPVYLIPLIFFLEGVAYLVYGRGFIRSSLALIVVAATIESC